MGVAIFFCRGISATVPRDRQLDNSSRNPPPPSPLQSPHDRRRCLSGVMGSLRNSRGQRLPKRLSLLYGSNYDMGGGVEGRGVEKKVCAVTCPCVPRTHANANQPTALPPFKKIMRWTTSPSCRAWPVTVHASKRWPSVTCGDACGNG